MAAVPSRGYLWFALRDAAVLPQTVLRMDNCGRHAPPWLGVNRCLGVEDGCAYFASDLADSAKKNELNAEGIPTVLKMDPDHPTRIAHIQGVARIPRAFDRVRRAGFNRDAVRFESWSGSAVEVPVRWRFLKEGRAALERQTGPGLQ